MRTKKQSRPRNDRCKRCKKVRKMWLRENCMSAFRVLAKTVPGEGKVCWICRIREVVPEWRPGMDIPEHLEVGSTSRSVLETRLFGEQEEAGSIPVDSTNE